MKNSKHLLAGFGLLLGVLAVFSIYWPGLHGVFFFDDHPNIVLNPGVKLDDLSRESLGLAWSSGTASQFGRPVSQLSFALNHYFSRLNPFAFKLTNLVIHSLNGVLIYFVGYQLLDSLRQRQNLKHISLWASLLAVAWMIHPIQLTSVLYVVQRMTSLSAFFLLLALVLHVLARRHNQRDLLAISLLVLAWCIFWPLSILSKETGVLLPAFVTAYELIVRRSERGSLDAFGRLLLYLLIMVILGLVPYLSSPFGQWIITGYEIRSFSLFERLLTEPRVLWEYIRWTLFPALEVFALFHDDLPVSTSLTSPWTTLPALAGLVGLLMLAIVTSRKLPLMAFGIAWFLVGHSLESSFIPLELVHEHRNYLPLFGLCLVPVSMLASREIRPGVQKTIVVAALGALLAYFGFVTAMRANMFGQESLRAQLEAQLHPASARANYEAGRTLAAIADGDQGNLLATVLGKKHFEIATELDPDHKMSLFGLLVLGCGASQTVDQGALDELQRRFRERLILQEDTSVLQAVVTMSGAGLLCLKRSDIDGLFDSFVANQRVSSDKKRDMYALHADFLWLNARDLSASRNALKKALEVTPKDTSLRLKWAQLDFIEGEKIQAKRLLLELRGERLSSNERKTLDELLSSLEGVSE
jgi:hypothetical protein